MFLALILLFILFLQQQQRRMSAHLCSVGGSQQQDPLPALKPIQLSEQLVQGLVPLLIHTNTPPAACNDTSPLIYACDIRRVTYNSPTYCQMKYAKS